ncbi:sterol esterase [Colletotrichum gloeosporioides Cg-14]|nr:sterol esterase [Colletotrichum gloeosporioides Cg-14]
MADEFVPTEGGPDPIVCDVGYYARRVGLDVEEFQVQTEDGFVIDLWHVYDPKEYTPLSEKERADRGPDVFTTSRKKLKDPEQKKKFPVLLMHGLLQSSGAYCTNDEDSLAFYLCKSGFDVWLGNNRCGFKPKHVLLEYSDPRMWCWNIRQMGVFDLPALTSRVLYETGFEKIGLICHSQGTTQTLVALAKEQRPDLGEKLTVFCALAPAAYAGPLIGKMYFKFMRIITPGMFRLMFGIHAFIPFMMQMHQILHPKVYGWLGYKVFSFLFDWTDTRWDRGLRDRMFQFAPVYVSSESMRWWLGRECFARHKCILSTKEDVRAEEKEDRINGDDSHTLRADDADGLMSPRTVDEHTRRPKGSTAWYNEQAPPFALWVAGNDDLVDGKKLLRRFERGREPHLQVVHSKVIDEYEHLDVIWAMDAPQQVFTEIREVLWKTCNARDKCRIPKGCEDVAKWVPPVAKVANGDTEESQSSSDDTE